MDASVLSILSWSGLIALSTVLLCAVPALAWSTWMGRQRWRTSALLDIAVLLPAGLPPALVAAGLWLGWRQQDVAWLWRQLDGWTPAHMLLATLLACCLMTLPWMIRLLRPAFEEVDPWLVPAARTLGVSPWRTWWRISLPMARPALASAMALGFAVAFSESMIAVLVMAALTPDTLPASPDWLSLARALKGLLEHPHALWGLGAAVLTVSAVGITLSEWSRRAWRRQLGRQRRTQRGWV
jgi:molybdate transport system permease protein